MPLVDFSRDIALDAVAAVAAYASLHSANPGSTGANEIAGGTPAYARQAVTWDPASGSVVSFDGTPVVFDMQGGDTVAYGGLWDSLSGGNWIGGDAVTNFAPAGQSTYTLTVISITAT